jgi:hypothetical protein
MLIVVDLRVNNVDNTISDKDIGGDNTGVIDKDTSIVNSDGQIGAINSGEHSSVLQAG